MIKNTKKNKKIKISTKSSNNSMEYNPIQEDYDENAKTRMFNKKIANNEDTILALRNKVKMLENKTNRLQSMNEIFLDLLKNQQKINKQHIKQNPDFIERFENRFNNISTNPMYPPEYNNLKMRKSNSQLNMFNIKDIKYYKEPIKLMQEQLKAYIFQTTLDRRRQEYLINEQISDLKSELNNRLLKLENQQKIQLSSIVNSINNGSYNNFESFAHKLMIQQRDREILEDFMEEKLRNITNINNKYNRNLNNNKGIYLNNRYYHNNNQNMNNRTYNSYYNNDYFG